MKDTGAFQYTDDGFSVQWNDQHYEMKWAEVQRLTAYKKDLFAIDEICLDIDYRDERITITEELPGWSLFVATCRAVFPSIPKDWEFTIAHPAFAPNVTTLFERKEDGRPGSF